MLFKWQYNKQKYKEIDHKAAIRLHEKKMRSIEPKLWKVTSITLFQFANIRLTKMGVPAVRIDKVYPKMRELGADAAMDMSLCDKGILLEIGLSQKQSENLMEMMKTFEFLESLLKSDLVGKAIRL